MFINGFVNFSFFTFFIDSDKTLNVFCGKSETLINGFNLVCCLTTFKISSTLFSCPSSLLNVDSSFLSLLILYFF